MICATGINEVQQNFRIQSLLVTLASSTKNNNEPYLLNFMLNLKCWL